MNLLGSSFKVFKIENLKKRENIWLEVKYFSHKFYIMVPNLSTWKWGVSICFAKFPGFLNPQISLCYASRPSRATTTNSPSSSSSSWANRISVVMLLYPRSIVFKSSKKFALMGCKQFCSLKCSLLVHTVSPAGTTFSSKNHHLGADKLLFSTVLKPISPISCRASPFSNISHAAIPRPGNV